MSNHPDTFGSADAWYTHAGPDDDVVLSTRIRLARNLANFPFPLKSSRDERDRIQALVFDAFSKMPEPGRFQAVSTARLDDLGRLVLAERCLLPDSPAVLDSDISGNDIPSGLVVRDDGELLCQVNCRDHLHIIGFAAGLAGETGYGICQDIDQKLQDHLQFAASYDFGFLTASLRDAGSGMKISVRVHLPSLVASGKIQAEIEQLLANGLSISACFGSAAETGGAVGAFYEISSGSSLEGTEFDQLASFSAHIIRLVEQERRARLEFKDKQPTVLKNSVYKAFAGVKFSRLISCNDAIVVLSDILWGLNTGLLSGAAPYELHALLFRVRDAHMRFLDKAGAFTFEDDIVHSAELKVNRLRCLILQESLESVQLAG